MITDEQKKMIKILNEYVQFTQTLTNSLSHYVAGENVVTFLHLGILNQRFF